MCLHQSRLVVPIMVTADDYLTVAVAVIPSAMPAVVMPIELDTGGRNSRGRDSSPGRCRCGSRSPQRLRLSALQPQGSPTRRKRKQASSCSFSNRQLPHANKKRMVRGDVPELCGNFLEWIFSLIAVSYIHRNNGLQTSRGNSNLRQAASAHVEPAPAMVELLLAA